MKDVAAGLASLGRDGDSLLVHMSPREVGGLQALAKAAGGSLTIHPQTGLPEAGFLQDILPAVAGIGLTMMGVPAWGVGLGSGLASLATGKDAGSALMSGLLAGGGAALFGPGSAAGENMGSVLQAGEQAGAQNWLAAQNAADAAAGLGGLPGQVADLAPMQSMSFMDKAGAGIQSAASDPMAFLKDNKYAAGALGVGALGAMGGFEQPQFSPVGSPEGSGVNAQLSKPFTRPYDESAPGGYYFTDKGHLQPNYAAGGGIGDYAAGGKLLDGPGDGVSDSIPAVINGEEPQRAALADGEFVIPARIVSELGNGSTKAGARRLYEMMERVQKARSKTVGKDKIAVDTNPDRLLPV